MTWLDREYYGTSVLAWATALGIAVALTLVLYYARYLIVARLRTHSLRTTTRLDDLLTEILAKTYFLFLLIASLYLGLQYIDLPSRLARVTDRIVVLSLLLQIAIWGNTAIRWWLSGPHRQPTADAASTTTVSIIGFVARVAVWALVLLMILDNLGVDITALVAGLGIGGVAVALALQNILGDVFASLSIALDKPFEVGDFVITGSEMGTVEYIGMKTTRLRSLSGEQIIIANADLLKSRIRNYKRMAERRVQFAFGILYETPVESVERVSAIVKEIIESQRLTRFDRAHFKSFGESSLDFEVVYFMKTADYNIYMDVQQAINLALLQRFAKEGISFAYPTRVLYVAKDVDDASTGGEGQRHEQANQA